MINIHSSEKEDSDSFSFLVAFMEERIFRSPNTSSFADSTSYIFNVHFCMYFPRIKLKTVVNPGSRRPCGAGCKGRAVD